MGEGMGLRESPPKLLVCHTGSEAFAPWTCAIMSKLGYQLLSPKEFEARAAVVLVRLVDVVGVGPPERRRDVARIAALGRAGQDENDTAAENGGDEE